MRFYGSSLRRAYPCGRFTGVISALLLCHLVTTAAHAQIETGGLPFGMEPAKTRVLILPTLSGPNVEANALPAVTDEEKHQFSVRGFQVASDSETVAASPAFKQLSDLTMENIVKAG